MEPGCLELLIHLPDYLADVVREYREWTYALMFGILVAETGLVFFGFLPGDSMLFTAGLLASAGQALDLRIVLPLMTLAAFTGDQINFFLGVGLARGSRQGRRHFRKTRRLEQARLVYARHGVLAVILGRFIPLVRSVAPLGAALSGMSHGRFSRLSAIGCVFWTGCFTLSGYFFGTVPRVRENFWTALFGIIAISLAPALAESLWGLRIARRANARKQPITEGKDHGK